MPTSDDYHSQDSGAARGPPYCLSRKTCPGDRPSGVPGSSGRARTSIKRRRSLRRWERRWAPEFRDYAHATVANASALASALIGHGFNLVSGGTDNHLILLDMTNKGLSGKEAAAALSRAGIVTNANSIPFDPRKPFDPSGVRIGAPAATTRGLGIEHMAQIGDWMNEVVSSPEDQGVVEAVRSEVEALMSEYPAPGCRATSTEAV